MDRESMIKIDYKRVGKSEAVSTNHRGQRLWLPLSVGSCGLLAIVLGSSGATPTNFENAEARQRSAAEWAQPEIGARIAIPLALPQRIDRSFRREHSTRHSRSATADQARPLPGDKPLTAPGGNTNPGEWHEVTVESGDTLSLIFSRLNILRELEALMELGPKAELLDSLYPGQDLRIRISGESMKELIYDSNDVARLRVVRTGEEEFEAELRKIPVEVHRAVASGRIEHSLYLAGADAGLSDQTIMELAELFGWDIDFALDIRRGDVFTVIYEEYYCDGEKVDSGNIVAAEFVNQGKSFRVLRYTDPQGRTRYYRPDGRSVRSPFLRTPVEIARISSPFDLHRRHPILNTIRAHRGVDYAAPTGTPIRATGAGVVAERGAIDGYGSTIILEHGTKYTTLYGHMSGYASGTDVGQHVQQGQIIGYIGSTGLATGPHLHYEFRIGGVHHDPLTVALPTARPLPQSEMQEFLGATRALRAELHVQVRHRLAMK